MASMPAVASRIVWPSSTEEAPRTAPIDPFAPPRFSMITGTPSDLDINGPTNRGIVSAVLPGGYGTTMVIAFSGKPAAAASGTPRDTADTSAAKMNVVHFISRSSHGTRPVARRSDRRNSLHLYQKSFLHQPVDHQ